MAQSAIEIQHSDRRIWRTFLILVVLFQCAALIAMLTHSSDEGRFLGRYSTSYALMLLAMGLITVSTLAGLYLFVRQPALVERIRRLLTRHQRVVAALCFVLALLGPFVLWYALPVARQIPQIGLFLALTTVQLGGLIVLLMGATPLGSQPAPRILRLGLVMLVAAVVLFIALRVVGYVPTMLRWDEPLIASWAYRLWPDLQARLSIITTSREHAALYASMHFVPLGALLDTTGESFFTGRYFYWLAMIVVAPVTCLTARQLYGRTAGWFAMAIALLVPILHNYLRYDAFVMVWLTIGIYWYVTATTRAQTWRYLLAGFFIGLTIEAHPLALRFSVAFILIAAASNLLTIVRSRKALPERRLLYLTAGMIVAAVAYVSYHALLYRGNPLDLIAVARSSYNSETGMYYGPDNLFKPVAILFSYIEYYVRYHPMQFVLYLLGLVWMGCRTASRQLSRPEGELLAVYCISLILYVLVSPKPSQFYFVNDLGMLILFTSALLGSAGHVVTRHLRRSTQEQMTREAVFTTAHTLAMLFIVATFVSIVVENRSDRGSNRYLYDVSFQIRDDVPGSARNITGYDIFYYGFVDRNFFSVSGYADATYRQWPEIHNVEPAQALIVTRGLDDTIPNLRQHIVEEHFVRTHCYAIPVFGRLVELYIHPDFVDAQADRDIDCPADRPAISN